MATPDEAEGVDCASGDGDDRRVATREVSLPGRAKAPLRAFLAEPRDPGPHPGVLVLHEILGLNDDIRRIAADFAAAGYVALAPDYFGAGVRALCIARAIASLRAGDGAPFARIESARAWLAARPQVDPTRVGAVGFCMGGGFALLYAARAPIGVVGTYYGDVPASADPLRGIAPVVGGFGLRDRVFGRGCARLQQHLDALGVPHDLVSYPDAGHSYMSHHDGWTRRLGGASPMHAGHDPIAAADSWRRMLAFFATHLGAAPTR